MHIWLKMTNTAATANNSTNGLGCTDFYASNIILGNGYEMRHIVLLLQTLFL